MRYKHFVRVSQFIIVTNNITNIFSVVEIDIIILYKGYFFGVNLTEGILTGH